MPASLATLPKELLLPIITYLDETALDSLSRVSRDFRRMAKAEIHPPFLALVLSSDHPPIPATRYLFIEVPILKTAPPLPRTIRHAHIDARYLEEDGKLPSLVYALPSELRFLQVVAHRSCIDPAFSRRFPQLLSLILEDVYIPSPRISLPSTLTHLEITTREVLPSALIASIIPFLPRLRILHLWQVERGGVASVMKALSISRAPFLYTLQIREAWEDGAPIGDVEKVKALTDALMALETVQPPIGSLALHYPAGWMSPIHLPLLHQALHRTLRHLSLNGVRECIFPPGKPWPHVKVLDLATVEAIGFPEETIFPNVDELLLEDTPCLVDPLPAALDPFPLLEVAVVSGYFFPNVFPALIRHPLRAIHCMGLEESDDYSPLSTIAHIPIQEVSRH